PVVVGRAVTELPWAVHLVAETPHPHVERPLTTVGTSAVADRRAARDVGVLQQVECLGHPTGAEVDGEHEFGADLLEPAGELVQSHLVGLGGVPGEVETTRSLVAGTHRVLPAE